MCINIIVKNVSIDPIVYNVFDVLTFRVINNNTLIINILMIVLYLNVEINNCTCKIMHCI